MSAKPFKTDIKATSPKQHPPPRFESLPSAYFFAPDLEREINRLGSVTTAKVISTGKEIDEIHVIAPRNRAPKKTVRDIESLLLVHFGIRIDHRCISVVQIDHVQTTHFQHSRPRIQYVSKKDRVVRIALAVGDKIIVGQAEQSDGDKDIDVTARAMIHAIEQLLQTSGVLHVVETHIAEMSKYQVVIVLVRWAFADQQELLVGASLAHEDLSESTARATLDAVNRRLVRLQAAQA